MTFYMQPANKAPPTSQDVRVLQVYDGRGHVSTLNLAAPALKAVLQVYAKYMLDDGACCCLPDSATAGNTTI